MGWCCFAHTGYHIPISISLHTHNQTHIRHTSQPPYRKHNTYRLLVGQHWQRTTLVLYSGGLEVLDKVEEVFTGHSAAFGVHNDGLGVRRSLFIDTRTLDKDKKQG